MRRAPIMLALLAPLHCFSIASADAPSLSDYFGFSGLDVIPIGDEPGPMLVVDLDGDGYDDIVVANNQRSRIEILRQIPGATSDRQITPPRDINEFPEHWRFERQFVPVANAVSAMATADLDQDGQLDLITGGPPGRVVFLQQTEGAQFKKVRQRDIPKLGATASAWTIADMTGDGALELISIVAGEPAMWPLEEFTLGPIRRFPAGAPILAVIPADYDGDGLMDLAGISPDDPAPVRIWFGRRGSSGVEPGPQTIFEMPPIVEFEALEPSHDAPPRIAVIERNARRIVVYDLKDESVMTTGDREAAFTVYGFPDPGRRNRAWAVVDINGDGLTDVVSADARANALAVFTQDAQGDLRAAESSPSLSEIDAIAVAQADDGPGELVVLSTKEGVVGRLPLGNDELAFPTPLSLSSGFEPVAMNVVDISGAPHAAVVVNQKRNYQLDLINLASDQTTTIDLGALSRKPNHIESADVNQDGQDDLVVLTPERPMLVLLADSGSESGFEKLEKDDMGQYGLVDAATAGNITTFDVDDDDIKELLIANDNWIRAVRFDSAGTDGAAGWRVVKQFNTDDPDSELVAVTPLDNGLVASDRAADRLLIFRPDEDGTGWSQREALRIRGFTPGALATGQFRKDIPGIMTIGEDGFALIPLGGNRRALHETQSWRSGIEGHIPHELAVGDVNSDGFGDMVALDAGEQMMEILTFSHDGTMIHATGFPVYESRLFTGGDTREFQPRQISIADVTGDGHHDVVLLCHDRILIYPQ
ncbi:MAG: VCBS repeat-containing protein [Phycisphaerales bacterium]|nr:VCBS repeat-containing protein [Phycisphaerales bacterium]